MSTPLQTEILVVDDSRTQLELLRYLLEQNDFKVAVASNGQEALEFVRANRPRTVISDIVMPVMDGYDMCAVIKDDPELQDTTVILLTQLSDPEDIVRGLKARADFYLTKPYKPDFLINKVRQVVEQPPVRIAAEHPDGLEVSLSGKTYVITAGRQQMLNLLFSTYESAVHQNRELTEAQMELKRINEQLEAQAEQLRTFTAELQEGYRRLQELEKLRDDLTHMIVHDMRTPLTSLIAGVQTLDVVGELNEEQENMVGIAVSGGETLLSMINDLLDVEKMESGSVQLDCTQVSAADLVATAVSQVAWLAERKQLVLVQRVAADVPELLADENLLRRTLVNLLGNAIKFTPTGGTVTVEAQLDLAGRTVLFSVSDTGEGIPSEAFARIFEKFGQVESRMGGRKLSTGLGLTFCKLAVEAHGGQIGVESVLHQGSRFHFTIPLPPPE